MYNSNKIDHFIVHICYIYNSYIVIKNCRRSCCLAFICSYFAKRCLNHDTLSTDKQIKQILQLVYTPYIQIVLKYYICAVNNDSLLEEYNVS